MLTRKQHDLLMFIHTRLQKDGVSPSYEEMKDALGLHSKSGIHRLVSALEERGFIRRLAHRARAVEILRLPEDATKPATAEKADSNVVSADFGAKPKLPAGHERDGNSGVAGIEIPLHGRIAAGTPIEALQNTDNNISVPAEMLGRGTHYALEVSGDSMIEAGILDGDIALIQETQTANDGEIVVALVDGEEATLKTLGRKGPQIILKPHNRDYSTQILPADRVRIQGRLVGLLRRYH